MGKKLFSFLASEKTLTLKTPYKITNNVANLNITFIKLFFLLSPDAH